MQEDLGRIVSPVLEHLDAVLPRGYSALLYGSGARWEYLAGVSDVNLLVVCETLDFPVLRGLAGALAGLRREKQPPPLLMASDEWRRAADVFPIEISDMRIARTSLRGHDPVAEMKVEPGDLRQALEGEFRARLLRLRQAYAAGSADPELLGRICAGTVSSIATLFRVTLALFERTAPLSTPACLAAAGEAMNVDTAPVAEVWTRRRASEVSCPQELFEGYLSAVAAAVRVTDQFTRGGN